MRFFSKSLIMTTAMSCGLLFVIGCQDAPIAQPENAEGAVKLYPQPSAADRANADFLPGLLAAKTSTETAGENLVANGSFETNGGTNSNTFTGWTVWNQAGGSGNYYAQTGTSSPISGYAVPSPTTGSYAAMSDQGGPGSHIIYQDVTIPNGGAELSFDLFIGNRADAFYTPSTLLYNAGTNQQFRMDIMDPNAAVNDMGSGILQTVHVTPVGSPLVSGYTTITASLDGHEGTTVRLRFAEADNALFFQAGIDNVSVVGRTVPVVLDVKPESSTNPVNLNSRGKLVVAILSDDDYDATAIDVSTVTLGDNSGSETGVYVKNNGSYQTSIEDVDGDGDNDLVMHFSIEDMVDNGDLTSSSTELWINGEDEDGVPFCGDDAVTIVP